MRRSLWVYAAALPLAILPLLGSYSPALVAKVLVLIALLNDSIAGGRRGRSPIITACFAWAVLAFTSLWWSAAPAVTLQLSVSLGLNVMVAAALCRLSLAEIRGLFPPLVLATLMLSFYVLIAPAQLDRDGRAGIGGVDENVTAFVLCVGFAAAIAHIFEVSKRGRAFFLIAAISMLAAIFHLGSRSGAVAVLLTVAVVYVAALRVNVGRIGVRAVALGLLLAAGVAFTRYLLDSGMVPARIAVLLSDRSALDDSNRSKIVEAFLHYQDQWWLTGVGYGADADFLSLTGGAYLNLHNQFWSSWVELGLAGILVLGSVATIWTRSVVRKNAPTWAIATLAPVLVFALTLGVDKADAFWFLLGAVAALGVSSDRRVSDGRGRR